MFEQLIAGPWHAKCLGPFVGPGRVPATERCMLGRVYRKLNLCCSAVPIWQCKLLGEAEKRFSIFDHMHDMCWLFVQQFIMLCCSL